MRRETCGDERHIMQSQDAEESIRNSQCTARLREKAGRRENNGEGGTTETGGEHKTCNCVCV